MVTWCPTKIWARSVQPFWRLLDTNKQTDKPSLYIDKFANFHCGISLKLTIVYLCRKTREGNLQNVVFLDLKMAIFSSTLLRYFPQHFSDIFLNITQIFSSTLLRYFPQHFSDIFLNNTQIFSSILLRYFPQHFSDIFLNLTQIFSSTLLRYFP